MHIKAICTVWLEEKLFKERLKFSFCNRVQHGNLLCLSIKVVGMRCKLLAPEPLEFFSQTFVLLGEFSSHGTNIS